MMYPVMLWPFLVLVAGTATTIPAVQAGDNRRLLRWLVLPSLFVGVAAFVAHFGGF